MTTGVGLDEAWDRATPQDITAAGYGFVARYLSYDTSGKNLTSAEADALAAAGLWIVSNWEYNAQAALGGYAQGVADAREADRQHRACGGPPDRPIYFSVDWDITDAQKPVAADYFRGVASVLGAARVGAYGDYWALSYLFTADVIRWGWQTYAWSGGLWHPRAQLRQVANGIHVAGHDVDEDDAEVSDFGQWQPGRSFGGIMSQDFAGLARPIPNAPDWMTGDIAAVDVHSVLRQRKTAWQPGQPGAAQGDDAGVWWFVREVEALVADAAAKGKQITDLVTVVHALATGGTSLDTTAVMNLINQRADAETAVVQQLQAQNTALAAQVHDLSARLAAAAHAEATALDTPAA